MKLKENQQFKSTELSTYLINIKLILIEMHVKNNVHFLLKIEF